ncbi:MAG: DUF6036 family nucleotidyltransferase [Solirubrobacteraceae bacterium]
MSNNALIESSAATDRLLRALGEQLSLMGHEYDLVVIGGSALLALGLVSRSTQDVDVVALAGGAGLHEALPLPQPLVEARDRVARDFALPEDWLNSEAARDMLRLGLPDGFMERLARREYGPFLTVRYASRIDQIHFKLHATVDRGGGKHLADLQALAPTADELARAARWARTHDPSEGFLGVLIEVLSFFGVEDADLGA